MVGVLGLLTGWALLMPAVLLLWMSIGLPYQSWMGVFLSMASSFPLLVVMSLVGIAFIGLGVRNLSRRPD